MANIDDRTRRFLEHFSATMNPDEVKLSIGEKEATSLTAKQQKFFKNVGDSSLMGALGNVALHLGRAVMKKPGANPPLNGMISEFTAHTASTVVVIVAEHRQRNAKEEDTSHPQHSITTAANTGFNASVSSALAIAAGKWGVGRAGQVLLAGGYHGLATGAEQVRQNSDEGELRSTLQKSTQDSLEPDQFNLKKKVGIGVATNTFRVTGAIIRVMSPNSSPYAIASLIAGSGASGVARQAGVNSNRTAKNSN